jgi:hypothetical protein
LGGYADGHLEPRAPDSPSGIRFSCDKCFGAMQISVGHGDVQVILTGKPGISPVKLVNLWKFTNTCWDRTDVEICHRSPHNLFMLKLISETVE